jgi:hypothetical protein
MPDLYRRFFWLWSTVVVRNLDSNLAGVLSFARKILPDIFLTSTRDDDVFQVDPRLADEVGLLVVCED